MEFLGKPNTNAPKNYSGELTLAQQAEIVQDLCNDDFLNKQVWKPAEFPKMKQKSPRIGKEYQANVSNWPYKEQQTKRSACFDETGVSVSSVTPSLLAVTVLVPSPTPS